MSDAETLLENWQGWGSLFSHPPQLLRELPGGLTNRSYLLTGDGSEWVLRVSSQRAGALGIDRHREQNIIRAAAAANIAPAIGYCSPDEGVLITEYLGAQQFNLNSRGRVAASRRLLSLVERIHALTFDLPTIDYYAHAESYWQQLLAAGTNVPSELAAERDRVHRYRDQPVAQKLPEVLCHRDLIPGNIIEREGHLYVIDWEYAAHGCAGFDYATIAVEWDVRAAEIETAFGIENESLNHAIELYRYTCALWHLVQNLAHSADNP